MREAIGVDLGGTKMLVGVVAAGPTILYRSLSTARGLDQDELLALLERELRAAIAARPEVAAIGLGAPCTIDWSEGVCVGAVHLPLAGVPLRELIAERLGLPTWLDNDANLAALAEHRHGVARGATNAVLLTIGTGIGGGLIIDGLPYRGSTGAGAELGHIVVDEDGPLCQGSCPNRGCVEALASGTALGREGLAAAKREPDSALGRILAAGDTIEGREVVDAARAGDPISLALLGDAGRHLGAALSSLANSFDPDLIVLGGGVTAAAQELLLDPARAELRRRALPPQNEVPVEPAALGEESGMIGAAILALDGLGADQAAALEGSS